MRWSEGQDEVGNPKSKDFTTILYGDLPKISITRGLVVGFRLEYRSLY